MVSGWSYRASTAVNALLAAACLFLTLACSSTSSQIVDGNYTSSCWGLFVEHERRIGGNYRIYPEGLHPSAFCSGLSMAKERGQLVPSLDQLARYLKRLRPGQVSKKPWKRGDVFIEDLGVRAPSNEREND